MLPITFFFVFCCPPLFHLSHMKLKNHRLLKLSKETLRLLSPSCCSKVWRLFNISSAGETTVISFQRFTVLVRKLCFVFCLSLSCCIISCFIHFCNEEENTAFIFLAALLVLAGCFDILHPHFNNLGGVLFVCCFHFPPPRPFLPPLSLVVVETWCSKLDPVFQLRP